MVYICEGRQDQMRRKKFIIVGNHLSLDFVNTQVVEDGKLKDLMTGYDDFIDWTQALGLLSPPQAQKRLKSPASHLESARIFEEVLEFRKVLRGMVEALSKEKPVSAATVNRVNALLKNGYRRPVLIRTKNGFEKQLRSEFHNPIQLLTPIAESAADLLAYGNPAYIKKCENPACVLYFYDISKNHKRRWCSMTACGNRAKAAAFYDRTRKKKIKT
jgi:predicted RNA-binding Zn ribbon-like protein